MIVILKGGTSAEREVSMWTAASVSEALNVLNLEFVEIDAADGNWLEQVASYTPEVVLIALHGPFGEDGTVQKALEDGGIPFAGSGSAASSVAIDKARTKEVVTRVGVRTPQSVTYKKGEQVSWQAGYPVVVKPNGDGSSYGISIVDDGVELQAAADTAFEYGSELLVEEYIAGTELSCGIIALDGQEQALPVVEIRPVSKFFNFEAKYTEGNCLEICPAPIAEDITKLVQDLSVRAFKALSCRHYARADWIVRDGVPYFLEINTLPGMTKTSLLPKELVAAGIEYRDFIHSLIKAARNIDKIV